MRPAPGARYCPCKQRATATANLLRAARHVHTWSISRKTSSRAYRRGERPLSSWAAAAGVTDYSSNNRCPDSTSNGGISSGDSSWRVQPPPVELLHSSTSSATNAAAPHGAAPCSALAVSPSLWKPADHAHQAAVATPMCTSGQASLQLTSRRANLTLSTAAAAGMLFSMLVPTPPHATAVIKAGVACPGLSGYKLSKCLREVRLAREAAEAAEDACEAAAAGVVLNPGDVQEQRLKMRQYEQPGTLVTLPSGVQYRELEEGTGRMAQKGSICEISYIVYRLSSGAYFKNSGGGTPIFLWSLGYGKEGKDDLGEVYTFSLGEKDALPAAAAPAIIGMREGGRRRILVPPAYGWVSDSVKPRPDTFGGGRRLIGHREEPLLFEAELKKVKVSQGSGSTISSSGSSVSGSGRDDSLERLGGPGTPYRFPLPLK